MGQFSWLDCKDTSRQIIDNKYVDVYLLIPAEFGGGHYRERCYNGYGNFDGHDVYSEVARWNAPERCTGEDDADRNIGIDLACYDEDNFSLRYPIKITHDPDAVYEDCDPSPSDPNQGWPE